MIVLSVFGGLEAGREACKRANIDVSIYYSSEIDKYSIKIANKNHPDIIQLGDITNWKNWDIDWASIDLFIGGSPCQGFSIAGKQLNFDDVRSKLFFVYAEILDHIRSVNPNVFFLLENVKMKQAYQDVISDRLGGVSPIMINSALVSAQWRERLYWTNIEPITQPKDKNIMLENILEDENCDHIKISRRGNYKRNQNKMSCLTVAGHSGGNHSDMDLIGRPIRVGRDENIHYTKNSVIYSKYGKSPTLTAVCGGGQYKKVAINEYEYRRYTPVECERAQCLPDNYTEGVSDSRRYKMLGDCWTVSVIVHILEHLKANRTQ